MGTKPTSRPERTLINYAKGVVGARRYTVPAAGGTLAIPAKVRFFCVKCPTQTTNAFALNFGSDSSTDYWRLEPGDQTPVIEITDSIIINGKGIGGPSIAEALFWG